METMDRLMKLLPDAAARALEAHRSVATEVRLRANRPAQLAWPEGGALVGPPIDALQLREILSALMDYSLYAHEAELAQGYFTMDDGSRVGVCGRFARTDGERLTDISSACVRVARAMPGCADALVEMIDAQVSLRSALLLSPPGMGKTTLLRDIARQLSEAGRCVGLADERHELAACRMGVPTLDVGPRTDVLDGCPRPQAIRHLIRSMAPSVIIADEIGGEGDAEALADAARCGVAIVASAHAESIEAALARPWLRSVVECGALRLAVLLGSQPGGIREIRSLDTGGDAAWRSA